MTRNLDAERSGVYPQQPNLTNRLSEFTLDCGLCGRQKNQLVKQRKRALYLGYAAVNSILASGTPGCFRGIG